ncbi:MAG: hypothetical protein ACKOAD_08140, partial [Gammaproteobacteria bacterium]
MSTFPPLSTESTEELEKKLKEGLADSSERSAASASSPVSTPPAAASSGSANLGLEIEGKKPEAGKTAEDKAAADKAAADKKAAEDKEKLSGVVITGQGDDPEASISKDKDDDYINDDLAVIP